jgi:hypothetical protein
MKRSALLAATTLLFALVTVAGCAGNLSGIPVPTSGSVTVTDAGVTGFTTVPLALALDAGLVDH